MPYHRWSSRLHNLEGHSHRITTIQFSPDGSLICTGSDDMSIKIWNSESGVLRTTLHSRNCISSIQLSPDGKLLATDGRASGEENELSPEIWIWHVPSEIVLQKIKVPSRFLPFAFFPCGDRLAAVTTRGPATIYIWGLESMNLSSYETESQDARDIHVSYNGQLLAIDFGDYYALFNVQTGVLQRKFVEISDDIGDVAISFKFSNRYVVFMDSNAICWVDLITDTPRRVPGPCSSLSPISLEFVPNTSLLGIYSSGNGQIDVIDLDLGTFVKRLSFSIGITHFKFAPSRPDYICSASGREGSLWSLEVSPKKDLKDQPQPSHTPYRMYFLPCGTKIFAKSPVWTRLYNAQDLGQTYETLLDHADLDLSKETFSNSGMAFTITTPRDGKCKAYYLEYGLEKICLKRQDVSSMKFSPNGDLLLVGSQSGQIDILQVKPLPSLLESFQAHREEITDIVFRPDGSSFLSIGRMGNVHRIKQWSTASKDFIRSIKVRDMMSHTTVSPNGQQIAFSSSASPYSTVITIRDLIKKATQTKFTTVNPVDTLTYDDYGVYLRSSAEQWNVNPSLSDVSASIVAEVILTVRGRWIYQGETKLLWMAPDYGQPTAVHGKTVALWHNLTGKLLFLELSRSRIVILPWKTQCIVTHTEG